MADSENQSFNPEPNEQPAAEPNEEPAAESNEQPAAETNKPSSGGTWWKWFLIILALCAVGGACGFCISCTGPSEEEKAEDKRKGFHCLSSYDGAHHDLKWDIKHDFLNDPDSFEHVNTRITPVDENGWHYLEMRFRGSNAFGVKMLATAYASVRNSDCEYLLIDIEQ